ncbi:MAG: PIN domain-containing protein [Proteobacteria bacterium]|nr:PIN domain-containing protein [Pseudomonadota bacterium]
MRLPEKIVDANVILRFFVRDNEEKFLRAKAFIQRLELGKENVLMTEIVFAEVVWVLNKVYEVPRQEIADTFSKVIGYQGIRTMLEKEIFQESLRLYAKHSLDIQDVFLAVLSKNKGCPIITFDKHDFKKLHCDFSEP